MAMPTSAALPLARSEPRTRTALLLEAIALRHQIAVLERGGTCRPCFRLWDRLFWILFSRWWPQWRAGLTTDERTELNRLRDEEPAPSFSLPTKHVSKSNETYCQRRRSSGASLHDRHYI